MNFNKIGNTPLISIIVPVYNVEQYLRKCLDSILVQTFTGWECVLVDDGSTDVSGGICDEYAAKDPRFIVVHKPNEGVAKARITAFEHSKGELITFIDADDYVSSDYLEKLATPILENDTDMVSCNFYYYIYEDRRIKGIMVTLEGTFVGEELKDFVANHYFYDKTCRGFGMTNFLCTKMIKRKFVLEGLKQGEGLWFGEDQTAMFSMLYRIDSLTILPERLYYYVRHEGQATMKYELSLWDSIITMFEKYEAIDSLHIATLGLKKRLLWYIRSIIFSKMAFAGVRYDTFVEHLSKIRKYPYMQNFLANTNVPFGVKDNVEFWMLKYRLYSLLYCLMLYKKRVKK